MREKFNIINPVAGSGKVALAKKIAAEVGGEIYYTKDENDIESVDTVEGVEATSAVETVENENKQ